MQITFNIVDEFNNTLISVIEDAIPPQTGDDRLFPGFNEPVRCTVVFAGSSKNVRGALVVSDGTNSPTSIVPAT
jgi:hypothetical protein